MMTKYPESNNKVNPNYVPESSVKKEYIEREALLAFLYNTQTISRQRVIQCIESKERFPAADVEPVRHAYWEEVQDGVFRCSDCHHCAIVDIFDRFVLTKCCHNCGAKMNKE